jgi:hypothetical protein
MSNYTTTIGSSDGEETFRANDELSKTRQRHTSLRDLGKFLLLPYVRGTVDELKDGDGRIEVPIQFLTLGGNHSGHTLFNDEFRLSKAVAIFMKVSRQGFSPLNQLGVQF